MPAPPTPEPVVYRVDWRDTIVFVNPAWTRFALDNDAPELDGPNVVNRPLWEFVSDPVTANVYRELLARARRGVDVRFSFRCDAPALRRFLLMRMTSGPDDEVEFETVVQRVEPRPPQALLDRRAARGDALVRMCGWCKRVYAHGGWIEVEEAVDRLGLFEQPVGGVTHAICESCVESMTALLGR